MADHLSNKGEEKELGDSILKQNYLNAMKCAFHRSLAPHSHSSICWRHTSCGPRLYLSDFSSDFPCVCSLVLIRDMDIQAAPPAKVAKSGATFDQQSKTNTEVEDGTVLELGYLPVYRRVFHSLGNMCMVIALTS